MSVLVTDNGIPRIPWKRHNMVSRSLLLVLWDGNPDVVVGFPSQRASDVELCFLLCCTPEQAVEQTVKLRWFGVPWRSNDVTVMPTPAQNTRHNDKVIITSKRRVYVIITLYLRRVFIGDAYLPNPAVQLPVRKIYHWHRVTHICVIN